MSKTERYTLIPSVYLILHADDKILLSRRFQTGFEDGKYGLVSGHVGGNETLREAMVREAREEVGITIKTTELEHRLTMHRWCGDHERIDFFFTCKKWSGDPENIEPDKCDDLSWFKITELPQNTIPYVREAIDCHVNNITYHEYGW